MDKHEYNKSIWYVVLMVLFGIFTYVLIDSGINTKTRVLVNYQESSDVTYKVYLLENDIYKQNYLNMGSNYISKMVDYIDFTVNYQNLFSKSMSGYYSYGVDATIIAYNTEDESKLWEIDNVILSDKVNVINQNDINQINISDEFKIDYSKYKEELEKFQENYEIDVSGYILVKFKIDLDLDFEGLDDEIKDSKVIEEMIPLSINTFKIKTINDYNGINSYNEYSNKSEMNLVFLVLGIFCLSISLAMLAVVVRNFKNIVSREGHYTRELKKILQVHGDKIVNVDRFYNKKKFNLIYVDGFKELLDVYNKLGKPISFKEVKRKSEAIFLIVEGDNAWIYRMIADSKIDK